MWRDRTNLYISYRQSYAHHPTKRKQPRHGFASSDQLFPPVSSSAARGSSEDRQGLLAAGSFDDDGSSSIGNGDFAIEMDVLPPRWADVTDEITELLDTVARKGQLLERLHQKHVLPAFNDDDAKRAEEGEIERLTQDITRAFHECQRAIKRVESIVRESKRNGTLTQAEESMAKNIQISLASRVQDASSLFRKKQSAYLKKLKTLSGFDNMAADRSSTPVPTTYNSDSSLLESDADRSYSQTTIQQQRQLHSNDSIIQQREREIEDIAQGIIELSDLFRDLHTMVIDQGTLLDRIDYNIESTATDVKGAEKELIIAEGYQKKTTKRKIILLLILVVVGMIILLAIKPKRHDAAEENQGPVPDPPLRQESAENPG
jgi:syntaxin 16